MNLEQSLEIHFGYKAFRKGQKEIIQGLLEGKDTLAVLPTGTGKSLCYQLTGYLTEGLVLIVSPLISLMEDQVSSFLRIGEKRVMALNGTLSQTEKKFVLQHLSRYKFLFLSPEMLLQESVLHALKQHKIGLLVVDEAHCMSQWGADFRPEYRNLGQAKRELNNPLTLALTASATPSVRQDIKTLILNDSNDWVYSANRPNITLVVTQTLEKLQSLKELLRQQTQAGIVYCATRKQVEWLYENLRDEFSVGYYHGGLQSNERRMLQQQFIDNQVQFLIATNAFGMGIDKPNIRLVVHYELPDSLENYLQEIGRAGRDGQPSIAVLLYQQGDERIHYFLQKQGQEERESFELKLSYQALNTLTDLQEKWYHQLLRVDQDSFLAHLKMSEEAKSDKLSNMLHYIHSTTCRRIELMNYFEELTPEIPVNCCDFHGYQLPADGPTEVSIKEDDQTWQEILIKMFKE